MKLKTLSITLNEFSWEPDFGRYKARVEYTDTKGTITMNLDPALSEALLGVCGDAIARYSKTAGENLHATIQASVEAARNVGAMIENAAPAQIEEAKAE